MCKLIALLTVVLTIAVVGCKKEAAPAVTTEEPTAVPAITTSAEVTSDVVEATTDIVDDVTADAE